MMQTLSKVARDVAQVVVKAKSRAKEKANLKQNLVVDRKHAAPKKDKTEHKQSYRRGSSRSRRT